MDEVRYTVAGMNGGQSAGNVVEGVSRVEGVKEVAVDLAARTVTVRGDDIEGQLVRTAIGAAGYDIVDAIAR